MKSVGYRGFIDIEAKVEGEEDDSDDDGMGFGLLGNGTGSEDNSDDDMGYALWEDSDGAQEEEEKEDEDSSDVLQHLIIKQSFEGSWGWEDVLAIMSWDGEDIKKRWAGNDDGVERERLMATALVVVWLRKERSDAKSMWELIVDKAVGWLDGRVVGGGTNLEELLKKAEEVVPSGSPPQFSLFD